MLATMRNRRQRRGIGMPPVAVNDPYRLMFGQGQPAFAAASTPSDAHPLHDAAHSARLLQREGEITSAFAAIEPVLREISAMQSQEGFADQAQALIRSRLGFELSPQLLKANWLAPLDMRAIHAHCAFGVFRQLAQREFDRNLSRLDEGEPVDELIRKWGFHAVDITPCADGRLSGVVDYILRIPAAVVAHRKSFAGAMFDIEEGIRNWSEIELRRHREGAPNRADEPTRYLKIGVYHLSGSDPSGEGCAAHGSDERKAAQALGDRLDAFARAIENAYCCGASVATLLVGIDTDNDAIRVHVPDAAGVTSLDRYVDNRDLFERTRGLAREAAKDAIRDAVAEAAGVNADDPETEGMRWFCGYLLKNNMAQIEYVRVHHAGRYDNLGHTERFITVGDSFDDVQMRNLAYQAQMETVEEGVADMDVGIKIFRKINVAHGLPVPVFVHFTYDGRVPGSRRRAKDRCRRLAQAIEARYPDMVRDGWLHTFATVRDRAPGSRLEELDTNSHTPCQCGCGGRSSDGVKQ